MRFSHVLGSLLLAFADPTSIVRTALPRDFWEWQNAHPLSAAARDGFRGGFYGRLDGDGWFHTTVTNVEPMAKQSHIIHYIVRLSPFACFSCSACSRETCLDSACAS